MQLPPEIFAVFAPVGNGRAELIAAFPAREQAEEWARTLARDFRRPYTVARYLLTVSGETPPVVIEPPVAATAAGSNHRQKTKRLRPGQRDLNRREPRRIDP